MTCSTGLSDDGRTLTRASKLGIPDRTSPRMATSPALDRRRRSLRAFVLSQPVTAFFHSRLRVATDLNRGESSGEAMRMTPTNSATPPTRIGQQLTRKNRSPSGRIASSAGEGGYKGTVDLCVPFNTHVPALPFVIDSEASRSGTIPATVEAPGSCAGNHTRCPA